MTARKKKSTDSLRSDSSDSKPSTEEEWKKELAAAAATTEEEINVEQIERDEELQKIRAAFLHSEKSESADIAVENSFLSPLSWLPRQQEMLTFKKESGESFLRRTIDFFFLLTTRNRRVLQARIGVLILVFLAAILLLSYSLYFYYVFETYGNTTSYFPWAWQINYSRISTVLGLSIIGVVISVFSAGFSLGATLLFVPLLRNWHTKS